MQTLVRPTLLLQIRGKNKFQPSLSPRYAFSSSPFRGVSAGLHKLLSYWFYNTKTIPIDQGATQSQEEINIHFEDVNVLCVYPSERKATTN